MIESNTARKIVEGIEEGLRNAKQITLENVDVFDNSEPFRKLDKMMTAVHCKIKEVGEFEVFEFYRGSHKLLLAYNKEKHILLSFMSEKRLKYLLDSRKPKDKTNYIFSLMQFNPDERNQQTMFSTQPIVEDILKKIQEKVRMIISEDGTVEYITVAYKTSGYNLLRVELIKLSKYGEIMDVKDISNYITVDYGNVYEYENESQEEIPGELEFNFNNDILTQLGNLDLELEDEQKKEEIKNG